MRKTLLKNLAVLIVFSLLINYSFGQIQGVTYTAKGITKSMADIIAYEKAHPVPVNYATAIRHDNEGPQNKVPNPNALPAPKNGFTPNGANSVTATQTVNSNFLSIWGSYAGVAGNESPYTPPDNVGEVGTTQVIACANCRMKVFTKPTATAAALTTPTGSSTTTLTPVLNVSLNTFFTIASIGVNSISDPHVRFDRLTQRWFVIAIDVNHASNNYCIIAVSNGPTVTAASNFTFYYFRPSTTGGSSSDFYDYPTLGIDKTSLLIGGNMFGGSFSGCNMWVVNKANLIAGTLTVTGFSHASTSTNMFTPQGVQNDDPSYSESYFVGTSQTTYSKLVMRRITYPGGTPTISSDVVINTMTTAAPMSPPSKGGTALDQDDDRPFAAMIKKNKIDGSYSLWTAHHSRINSSGVGSGSGDRDGSVWFQLGTLTTTPTILQSGTVYDGTTSVVSMIYPSVAMSGQGHTVMALSTTGSNKYATATVAGRYRTDATGTFQSTVDLTNATSTYNPGANRWGDYTQTSVDPSDDQTIWVFTEYANTTNSWGVRAAQLIAPPPPAAITLSPSPTCGTNIITINGTSVNNSEFFDPGADVGGPGFNRLQVAVSGPSPVTVTSVTFVSPTQITANFSIPSGTLAGTYTITVTNPDGQTTSTTFNLANTCPFIWIGVTSTDWTVGSNWSDGVVPNLTGAAIIPSGTPFSPIVLTGKTGNCKDLTVESGAVLTVQPNATLNISH